MQLHTPVIFYFEEGHQDGEIHAPPSTSPGKVPRKAPPRLFLCVRLWYYAWKLQQEPSRQPAGPNSKHPNMGREKEDKHTTVRVRVCACACSCSEADSRPSRVEASLAYFDQRWIIQHDLPGDVSLVRALAFMGKRERTRRLPCCVHAEVRCNAIGMPSGMCSTKSCCSAAKTYPPTSMPCCPCASRLWRASCVRVLVSGSREKC